MTFVVTDDALEHHGVKGMHWGQHKAHPSGSDRRAARERHAQRITEIDRLLSKAELATGKKQRAALVTKANQIAKEGKSSGDVEVGFRMSKGEAIVGAILTGGLGNLAVSAANKQVRTGENAVLDMFANFKVSDLRQD